MFYVTDLRHFEGIESDPDAPAPALSFATYLRRVVRAATARSEPGPHPTGIACRRRPQHRRCPGHLRVEVQNIPSQVQWACPACGEAGLIDGWQGTVDDLSCLALPSVHGGVGTVALPEEAYRVLLEEPNIDSRWARVVYGAVPNRDGVTLWGTEEELAALARMASIGAQQATGSAAQRRWRQLAGCLEPLRTSWLEHATDVVTGELEQLGLLAPRAKVTDMIRHGLDIVASEMGVSAKSARAYVHDEELRELARNAAVELADEQPGADLHDQARTIPMPLPVLGRTIAGLAELAHVRILNADEIGAHGSLELISLIGQILHENVDRQPGPVVLPQGALTRAARLLEATATILTDGGVLSPDLSAGSVSALALAFLDDAKTLRTLVAEYGTSPGSSPSN